MSENQNTSGPDSKRIILLVLTFFTWIIGAILYLIMVKPKGVEFIVCILACFIPFIPAVILILNSFGIIKLG